MRCFVLLAAALAGIAALACTPVYQYEVISMHVAPDEAAAIEARVEALLAREGFKVFRARGDEPPLRHTGLHYCAEAVDVATWLKQPPGVAVDQLRCAGKPWFYVSRTQSYGPTALSETERIRDLLSEEFAPELANGTLQFDAGEQLNIE